MGGSSSTEHNESADQRQLETLAASTGALPMLQKSFSVLSNPQTNAVPIQSLQRCFCLKLKDTVCEGPVIPDSFPALLDHLGSSIVDLFFVGEKGGLSWVEFIRAYVKCCGRMSVSMALNTLLRVFALTVTKAGLPLKLEFESDDADCKISGFLVPSDVLMLLWLCWSMTWASRTSNSLKGKANLRLPDISHLVLSSVVACSEIGTGLDLWERDISGLEAQLLVGKFLTWALTTVPNLSNCFTQFVHGRLQNSVTSNSEDDSEPPSTSLGEASSNKACNTHLLTCGRAWSISLSCTSALSDEILRQCFLNDGDGTDGTLLYRSSLHGRGLNRFWSNIEGYNGPLLILVAAAGGDVQEGNTNVRKWIIGAFTQQGFENRDVFYGNSGKLYAICPVFHVFAPSGKEKNFVYSHLHPTGRVYEPHPKPVGIAFGGSIGNERIFINEDFATITIRHHATDKTYQPGSLIPYQGFLPVEASISEVEVWGLGGRTAKEVQASYKKREELFTEQRRKVDLKTFASWEDSPEKMMMDMVTDPNRVRREDR